VLVSDAEVAALSRLTALPPAAFTRLHDARLSLAARDGACVFLKGRLCSVYEARPTQCRTYPFWPEVMSPLGWLRESARCEGIGRQDVPATPDAAAAISAVQSDLALAGEATTYEQDRALLLEVPDAVAAHIESLRELDGTVLLDTAELCVVDSPDQESQRATRTLVLKSAPALDQSVAFLCDGALVRDELAMPVHRALALSMLLVSEAHSRILVIGGGGCSLPLALSMLAPHAAITVVELSAGVAHAARTLFMADADETRVRIVVADGAAFVQSVSEVFDLIILDAASASASPAPELATRAFMEAAHQRLADGGVLCVNAFGDGAVAFEQLTAAVFGRRAAVLELQPADAGAHAHTIVFAQRRQETPNADDCADEWRRLFARADDSAVGRLAGAALQQAASSLRSCSGA
jgi:spermidine synthase